MESEKHSTLPPSNDEKPISEDERDAKTEGKKSTFNARTLHEFDTGFFSDSVEWCPVSGHRHLLACGTYQLVERDEDDVGPQIRLGRLFLFRTSRKGSKFDCVPVQDVDMPGILDAKWRFRTATTPTLAVVNSVGQLVLLSLNPLEDEADVEDVSGADARLAFLDQVDARRGGENSLALSLDWSDRVVEESSPRIVVSDSKGGVSVMDVSSSRVSSSFPAHQFEAWIAAFDSFHPEVVFSGGDDAKLKRWDLRCDPEASGPTHVDSRNHEAGVCSLHAHPLREHYLASGSYDETVRVWDARNLKTPLSSLDVGGGVWRLKWRPDDGKGLLCACMHGGARELVLEDDGELKTSSSYHGHESIVYGADYNHDDACLIATSSFYDHHMHVWTTATP